MNEEIINTALENLRDIAGVEGHWKPDGPLDGVLQLYVQKNQYVFLVKAFNELRGHNLIRLNEIKANEPVILLANHILPKVKKELQLKNIPYIETNGNVFLNRHNTFLLVDTHKPAAIERKTGNRAFSKTGLKVVFHLLRQKEDVNFPQRQLAEKTGVALGNIPQVIEGLKETGYLIPLKKGHYVWEKRKELLERWINEYDTVLKPKLSKERYTFQGNFRDIKLNHALTVWGGEPAADMLTNYLRPEKYMLYTREKRKDLMKNYRFIPQKDGEIEVLEMFWNNPDKQITAPPILVYADLLLEGGKRNIETAEKIFNEYIEPNL